VSWVIWRRALDHVPLWATMAGGLEGGRPGGLQGWRAECGQAGAGESASWLMDRKQRRAHSTGSEASTRAAWGADG
jgi:hypothetical protein